MDYPVLPMKQHSLWWFDLAPIYHPAAETVLYDYLNEIETLLLFNIKQKQQNLCCFNKLAYFCHFQDLFLVLQCFLIEFCDENVLEQQQ
mgnify:CR=1 FL=1